MARGGDPGIAIRGPLTVLKTVALRLYFPLVSHASGI